MALQLRDIYSRDDRSFPYILEQDVNVPLKTYESGFIRVNIYRPHDSDNGQQYPVLATYGPYGKDVHYGQFRKTSFDEINAEHKCKHSAWETPDPQWWTHNGYIIVRADERGIGQSPGLLDTMSRGTSEGFFDVVEWAAIQPWSNGKVGLLGISYYAGTQWRVAARKPRGLAAIIPWEGMSDYYRDRCRHGGILSNAFINFWWHGQVVCNQYGRTRRPGSNIPETLEGVLSDDQLAANLYDQTVDNAQYKFRDEEYYASRDYRIEDIDVPLLSVANWYHEEALLQKSFLDAFLKDADDRGWTRPGQLAQVSIVLREGDVGINNEEKEKQYRRRDEPSWPLPSTKYEKYYLLPDSSMASEQEPSSGQQYMLRWRTMVHAPKRAQPASFRGPPESRDYNAQPAEGMISFITKPFTERTEFTGHIVAHLNVTIPLDQEGPAPSDIDLFVTIRHLNGSDREIFYTGTAGDPVPITKGWLRCSLRATESSHPWHREHLPYRNYFSASVSQVTPGEIYPVDVEVWPTNVIISPGSKLVFEIAGADTQGSGIFTHDSPIDRPESAFKGWNALVFDKDRDNYVLLPRIPDI